MSSPLPQVSPVKGFHIPSLDGLRAVAIVIVFLSHAGLHRVIPGLFGVTIFFFLSGYLITTLLRLELEQRGAVSLRDFYLRRFLRIFPPFYLVMGGIVLLTSLGVLPGELDGTTAAAQALHLANYEEIFRGGVQPPGTEVFWSLAVEEHFYLVFPFLYLGLRSVLPQRRHQFMAFAVLAAAVLGWRMFLVNGLHVIPLDPQITHHPRISHATDTRFDSLLFGCMLAVYGNPALDSTPIRRGVWIGVAMPLALLGLGLSFALRGPVFRETYRYTLQGIALFPLFIGVIRFADWGVFRFLNGRLMRFIGLLSYPIYLIHPSVILLVRQALPRHPDAPATTQWFQAILVGLAAFGVSVVVALLIHRFIEIPCARWRKRLSRVVAPTSPILSSGSASGLP